jgi:hypothetical protein
MKSFFSKSDKELYIASSVFAIVFLAIELIAFDNPADESYWDSYRSLVLCLVVLLGEGITLSVLIYNQFLLGIKKSGRLIIFVLLIVIYLALIIIALHYLLLICNHRNLFT